MAQGTERQFLDPVWRILIVGSGQLSMRKRSFMSCSPAIKCSLATQIFFLLPCRSPKCVPSMAHLFRPATSGIFWYNEW